MESILGEIHERESAAMGTWFGTELPNDFGDFNAEYQHARNAAAMVDTNFQMVAELTGPDRVRYLNAVTTANIQGLAAGESAIGLLLNSQGHILDEFRTLAMPERLLFLSHAMVADRTLATLDKFIIMDDVMLTDRSAEFGSLSLIGPAAPKIADEVTGIDASALAKGAHAEARAGGLACQIIHSTFLGLPGFELIIERQHLPSLWALLLDSAKSHGGGRAGYRAIDALRLEVGAAWFGVDFDDRVIPHEAGIEQSHISYTKGCYTGQEIVERVRSRGHVNRRLTGLGFSRGAIPKTGAQLLAGQDAAGWVTSAAYSPLAKRAIGLGYLRREVRELGSRVSWEGGEAEVIGLPLAGAI
jgi:folate-binding protein YgfZ